MGCGKMKSGGAATKPIKKMKSGGIAKDNAILKDIINKNGVAMSGTTGAISMKNGGSIKAKKFAALARPYDKATAADRIAGAKKNARKKK
jgi:hypothetical protein